MTKHSTSSALYMKVTGLKLKELELHIPGGVENSLHMELLQEVEMLYFNNLS